MGQISNMDIILFLIIQVHDIKSISAFEMKKTISVNSLLFNYLINPWMTLAAIIASIFCWLGLTGAPDWSTWPITPPGPPPPLCTKDKYYLTIQRKLNIELCSTTVQHRSNGLIEGYSIEVKPSRRFIKANSTGHLKLK